LQELHENYGDFEDPMQATTPRKNYGELLYEEGLRVMAAKEKVRKPAE